MWAYVLNHAAAAAASNQRLPRIGKIKKNCNIHPLNCERTLHMRYFFSRHHYVPPNL